MRIVYVNIARNNATGPELYKIDHGTKIVFTGLILPDVYEVHYSKSKTEDAYRQLGDETGAIVPDELLQTDGTLYGWIYVHTGADDGWTKREFSCKVKNRPNVSSVEPTPVQQDIIEQSIAALNAGVEHVDEALGGLQETVETALQEAKDSGEFDGPKGDKGDPGAKGDPGYTPQKGVDYFDGAPGDPGTPGISPTVTVTDITGGHRITITDADGAHSFDVMDGDAADAPVKSVNGQTGAVVLDAQDVGAGTYSKPAGGIPASDLAAGVIPTVPVQNVQVNGISVLSNGVANIPAANTGVYGTVKIASSVSGSGISVDGYGNIVVSEATSRILKQGTNFKMPVVASTQHESVFYGLAKAAGDATQQSADASSFGNYTESAKSAISQMLNGAVSVVGTTPTITALPGIRYTCGEVLTLDITPPASGDTEIIFSSGSTPTVLTVPNTIKWPVWFNPASLVANTTYDIIITDGALGMVMAWT